MNSLGYRSILTAAALWIGVGGLFSGGFHPTPVVAADHTNTHTHDHFHLISPADKGLEHLRDNPQELERQQHRQAVVNQRWHELEDMLGSAQISKRSHELLRQRGLGAALLEAGDKAGAGKAYDGVDTLKVLVIRIGFDENRDPHLSSMDPSGDFMLEPLDDPTIMPIDRPPHNKAFYEAHLQGLSEFYDHQSGGRLHIEGRVLPEGDNDSYKLTDVADYGPGAGGLWSLESLELLVTDMMDKADEQTQIDGSADLSDYDDSNPFTYIIFVHAGSDWQSDVAQDSPNDIPTFFISLGEPHDLPDSGGSLSECSIIPETTNQDGYHGSIAAAFYHEFGHALGLPDVYSTSNMLPSVGIWDLMDSGTNLLSQVGLMIDDELVVVDASGVLPPSLSAWCKWFLGWVEIEDVQGGETVVELPAVQIKKDIYGLFGFSEDSPQVLRAGASSRDFFLLENRWVPWPPSETPFEALALESDEATGVIMYMAGQLSGDYWINSGLYDFYLPAGGVLCWHVNADRIQAGLASNRINVFGDGLRLVEADGIQDIGVLDAYVQGWYGSINDPFGDESGYRNLYTDGFPNSRCYDRSWTGVSLSDVGDLSPPYGGIQRLTTKIEPLIAGYPWDLAATTFEDTVLAGGGTIGPRRLDPASLTPIGLSQDTQILVFSDAAPEAWTGAVFPAAMYALNRDGEPIYDQATDKPVGAFAALDSPLAGSPVAMFTGDGVVDLAWITQSGVLEVCQLGVTSAAAQWSLPLLAAAGVGPVSLDWDSDDYRLLCALEPNTVRLVDSDGDPIGLPLVLTGDGDVIAQFIGQARPLPWGDMATDMAVLFSDLGWHLIQQEATGLISNPEYTPWPRSIVGSLQTAVVPIEAGFQLNVFDLEGEVGTWHVDSDGDVSDPGIILGVEAPVQAEPAVADLDGDGGHDLILSTPDRIFAIHADGVPVRGYPARLFDMFPLADTTRIAGPVVVADATADGLNEVFFATDGGHLLGLNATGNLLPSTPFRWGDLRTPGLALGEGVGLGGNRVLWLASSGGYAGPPMERQFINGRIVGYALQGALSGVASTSQWHGPGGSALGRGVVGEALFLEDRSPVRSELGSFILYPNPLDEGVLTVRFFSAGDQEAQFALFTVEGEEVIRLTAAVIAGQINEIKVSLPALSSGLYVSRLQWDSQSGFKTEMKTLAVER